MTSVNSPAVGQSIEAIASLVLGYVDVKIDVLGKTNKPYSMILLIGSGVLRIGDQELSVRDLVLPYFRARKGDDTLFVELAKLDRDDSVGLRVHLVNENNPGARDGRGAMELRWRVVGLEV